MPGRRKSWVPGRLAGEKSDGENSKKDSRDRPYNWQDVQYFRGQLLQHYIYILHFAATLKLLNYPTEVFENVALQDLTLFFLFFILSEFIAN